METPKIFESEYKFCLILWEHEPVAMSELVKHCAERLEWKRTTTYTVVKRLGERGVLKNEDGVISSLISKEQAQAAEIDELVEKKFDGSLPAFIAAFTHKQKLSREELDELQDMIDRARKEAEK
jgi:predicted transcriptional regulator